ncbi:MAG: cardiolipin synthase B [Aquisalimonadaceae bacterium]
MKRVPYTGHQLYFDGDTLYQDMLRSIDQARHRVWIESYIFAADHTGRRFGAALARAARRGLDVRLHLDAAGSLFLIPRKFLKTLELAGVRVRTFHRWSWRDPWRYNRRNHCKLLITDSASVYLGGFNIHDQSSRISSGERCWRDTHIRLDRLDLVRRAADVFNLFWTRRLPRRLRRAAPPDLFVGDSLVTNRIPRHRHALRRLFRLGLLHSRQRVLLTTPYFAPDRRTRRHLVQAAARGAEVCLLLPAVSDNRITQMAARYLYERLLRAGIRIYEYNPRPLHAKTIVVDGKWASIGTANLDYRSLFHNYEINFVTDNPEICRGMETIFESDLSESTEITLTSLRKFGLWERLGGRIGWRLRWWL